jgi:16S rRNA (uracil1498-N3)-methyltransferase
MELFFDTEIEHTLCLNEQESRHCIQVLRYKAGDTVRVSDGLGHFFNCRIIDAHAKRCKVEIISKEELGRNPYSIHIAIAPTKNMDRLEWFVEKVTELGVDTISLLVCEHSERRKVRMDRLEKVAVAATKQSLKGFKPKINELIQFHSFIDTINMPAYIAHCHTPDLPSLKSQYTQKQDSCILIGPEGDFSLEEISYAKQQNVNEISLGNSRLRTETAGIIACHTIHLLNS